MNFIKEVLKKLLIAIVTGAIILAFVYYKDHYLEQGNSDMEMLNSVTLEKEKQDEKIMEKETNEKSSVGEEDKVEQNLQSDQTETPLVIEVEKPYEEPVIQNSVQNIESTKEETPIIVEEKTTVKEKEIVIKKVEEDLEKEIKKYRGTPQETSVNQLESQPTQKVITNEPVVQQQSFDEFKSSVKSRAQSAFDELDSETN